MKTKKISLSGERGKGLYALIDEEDYEKVSQYRWYMMNDGYICTTDGSRILLHRYILNITHPKIYIDHKNHNKADNRKENLRICTARENQANKRKANGNSQYKGVSWNTKMQKWKATIQYNGKPKYLGCFIDEKLAAKRYDQIARETFGEFALLNFPEENDYTDVINYLSQKSVGYCWNKKSQKWQASIYLDGKIKFLGLFSTEEQAAQAYDQAISQNSHLRQRQYFTRKNLF